MALTRITSSVIKDATIQETKFDKSYLDSNNADIATQSITFESDVTIKVGSAGSPYFAASSNLITITAQNSTDTALQISRGGLSLNEGNITIADGFDISVPQIKVSDGSSSSLSFTFDDDTTTGFYRVGAPADVALNLVVDGSLQVSAIPSESIRFANRLLKIRTDGNVYADLLKYDTNNQSIVLGGATKKLNLTVDSDNVINVSSVDQSGNPYTGNENRVGINNSNPQATFDVTGTIRATNYSNITSSDLPVVPVSKGGTGTSNIGFPEQLLRVNTAGDALEYFSLNTGDVNNLASFNVSGDGTLYSALSRSTSNSRLVLTLNSSNTFFTGQVVKVFGINTTNITQYDQDTVGNTIYSNWKDSIDQSTSFISAQGGAGGGVRYTYYAALINFRTGVISSLKKLKHSSTGAPDYVSNYELDTFNDQRYNSISILRPNASHGILLYRFKSTLTTVKDRNGTTLNDHDKRLNLIAIIGSRDIGSATTTLFTYNDYGPYNRTTWGDFNTDGSYNANYQQIKTIPCSVRLNANDVTAPDLPIIADYGPYPGWSERNVFDVNKDNETVVITNASSEDAVFDNTDLSSQFIDTNKIQICHDDTEALEKAIQSVIDKGYYSLFLTGGTYNVKKLIIPDNFSLNGSGKATLIRKQFFDTSYSGTTNPEYSRTYAALWLRNPWGTGRYGTFDKDNDGDGSIDNPTYSEISSVPVKDITLSNFAVDGNYNCNIRLGDSTRPDSNALVYMAESNNCSLLNLDIKNSIGDGIYAESSTRLSLQNTSVYDNSITYLTFDNPVQATDAVVFKATGCAFLSNPGPVDITTSQVVAFNSCIIRNSGTGLRIYGSRSANVNNNLILGPDDEWIPSSDIYDSDFNSVNITVDKTTRTGTGGPVKFTYVENNLAKDLTNTELSSFVYTVSVDVNGNEVIGSNPLTYTTQGSSTPTSVLQAVIYDIENGGLQIEVPAVPPPNTLTANNALYHYPYRVTVGTSGNNYDYLIYFVNGTESIAVGDPDNYIIDGVIGYNNVSQIYTIKIADENRADFLEEDRVQVLEHNPDTGYSLPSELIVSAIRFEDQSFVLDLSYPPGFGGYSTFNDYHNAVNQTVGGANGLPSAVDQNARGYIKKKRSFTIAKGIIGVL